MNLTRAILLVILFLCFKSNATTDYEIIVCDNCSYPQKEIQVMHRSNTLNGTVIVVDFPNRSIVAFGRQDYYEPGYSTIFVWEVAIPIEY